MQPKKPPTERDGIKDQMLINANIRKIILKNQSKRELSAEAPLKKSIVITHKYQAHKFESNSTNTSRLDTQQSCTTGSANG